MAPDDEAADLEPAEPIEDPAEAPAVDTDGWPALTPRTCASGTPHAGCTWAAEPCAGCQATTAEGRAEFRAAVEAGQFDAQGHELRGFTTGQRSLF